ncbi:MAG: response regulator transcription factor [Anaerolineae bacterium]|nr:response regulator transcription factor [Anaerolineae bacterium]
MGEKILVIDDDPVLLGLIEKNLNARAYEVFMAANGEDGLRLLEETRPHLVILDVMIPGLNGWEVCRRIRKVSTVPVIMLTALGSQEDIVRGLEAGADDYLVKPFLKDELLARVSAVLRRASMPPPSSSAPLRFGNGELVIDPATRQVMVRGQPADLTPTEFELLLFMAYRPGQIVRTEHIFENVWAYDTDKNIENVKWYVWRLRKKVEKQPGNPKYIITERGVGYRFIPNYGMSQLETDAA